MLSVRTGEMGYWDNVGREGAVGGPQSGRSPGWHLPNSFSINPGTEHGHPKATSDRNPRTQSRISRWNSKSSPGAPPPPETPSGSDFTGRCPCPVRAGPRADPRSRASLLWPPPACWFSDPDGMPWVPLELCHRLQAISGWGLRVTFTFGFMLCIQISCNQNVLPFQLKKLPAWLFSNNSSWDGDWSPHLKNCGQSARQRDNAFSCFFSPCFQLLSTSKPRLQEL